MEIRRNESRLGRFAYLLNGGAKPRRNHALMFALVLVAFLSFAGVVSADDYYKGMAPITKDQGTVTGGSVDVQYSDTWDRSTNYKATDEAWANFTLQAPATGKTLKFARLYVVVYSGSMTANYIGNETIKLYNDGTYTTTLADHQTLDVAYDRTQGIAWSFNVPAPFTNLSRVTSDYVSVFNVTDYITSPDIAVNVMTMNTTRQFDGRIKEVKIVYGWDDSSSDVETKYWINEGQDPITKYTGTYTDNKTWFNGTGSPAPSDYVAKLWVNYLDNYPSNGTYTWNGNDISTGSMYPPTTTATTGAYSGMNFWTWESDYPDLSSDGNNVLTYSNTSAWYKIPLVVFTIQ